MRRVVRLVLALVLPVILVGFAAVTFSSPASSSDVLLLQKHLDKKITCNGCHQENPPAKAVKTNTCLSCHGTFAQLADKTEGKAAHNPHASHNGDLDCDSCHHVHKASENYCAQCHQFEFKVP